MGRLPRPQPKSSGFTPLHPPSATQRSHCSNVTSYLLSANGEEIVTRCCVSAPRYISDAGEPIVNCPAGITTISGHSAQSVNEAVAAVDTASGGALHAAT